MGGAHASVAGRFRLFQPPPPPPLPLVVAAAAGHLRGSRRSPPLSTASQPYLMTTTSHRGAPMGVWHTGHAGVVGHKAAQRAMQPPWQTWPQQRVSHPTDAATVPPLRPPPPTPPPPLPPKEAPCRRLSPG